MTQAELLADLHAKVATEVFVSDWITITQPQVDEFAHASGDHQWIHVDPERAAAGPFGGTIAHGLLVLGTSVGTGAWAEGWEPLSSGLANGLITSGVLYGFNRIRYPNATRVGAQIRHHCVLQSAEAVGTDTIQFVIGLTVEIQGESKPACVAEGIGRAFLRS